MDKHPTPEERLLNLIKHRDSAKKNIPEGDTKELKQRPSENPWARRRWILPIFFSPKVLKKILIGIVGLLSLYILSEFLFFRVIDKEVTKGSLKGPADSSSLSEDIPSVRPYSYYAEKFNQRDLFDFSSSGSNALKGSESGAAFKLSVSELKLVGIILDNNPQAIIENKKENKTYFLHKGESINDFKIEKINEDGITLSNGSQNWELAL